MKFKIGDVVRLKSGGPWMTVSNVDQYAITVLWFDGGRLYDGRIKEAILELYPISEYELDIDVRKLMSEGQKIEAIKLVRTHRRLSLQGAKAYVEKVEALRFKEYAEVGNR